MTAQNETLETNSGDGEAVKDPQENGAAMEQSDNSNSSEELQDLKNQLQIMSERMQQQSAIIGKLTNEAKSQNQKLEPEGVEKNPGEVSQYRELEEKLDKYESRFKQQEKAAKLSEIELGLVEAGASPALAKEQADYFAFKLGDRIVPEENDGVIKHKIVDTNGEIVPITQWAKAHLESDSGSYLKAHKTGPSVQNKGTSGGNAQKTKLSSSAYSSGYAEANARGIKEAQAFAASHTFM